MPMAVLRAAVIREEVIPEAVTTEAANMEAAITAVIMGAGIITADVITTTVPGPTSTGSPIMLTRTITLIITRIGPPGFTLNSLTGITVRLCKHITLTSRVAPAAGRQSFLHRRKAVKGSARQFHRAYPAALRFSR